MVCIVSYKAGGLRIHINIETTWIYQVLGMLVAWIKMFVPPRFGSAIVTYQM